MGTLLTSYALALVAQRFPSRGTRSMLPTRRDEPPTEVAQDMNDKLVIEDLYKIFGPETDEALRLLEQGLSKDEIYARTRTTVGVQGANFAISEGEVFVVMGLSGSGKSTLVRMLNRLIEPPRGRIYVDGKDITAMCSSLSRCCLTRPWPKIPPSGWRSPGNAGRSSANEHNGRWRRWVFRPKRTATRMNYPGA